MAETGRLRALYAAYLAGRISRRDFLLRAAALGLATPVALGILRLGDAAAQEATPGASGALAAPDSGTEGQTRGAGRIVTVVMRSAYEAKRQQ